MESGWCWSHALTPQHRCWFHAPMCSARRAPHSSLGVLSQAAACLRLTASSGGASGAWLTQPSDALPLTGVRLHTLQHVCVRVCACECTCMRAERHQSPSQGNRGCTCTPYVTVQRTVHAIYTQRALSRIAVPRVLCAQLCGRDGDRNADAHEGSMGFHSGQCRAQIKARSARCTEAAAAAWRP